MNREGKERGWLKEILEDARISQRALEIFMKMNREEKAEFVRSHENRMKPMQNRSF